MSANDLNLAPNDARFLTSQLSTGVLILTMNRPEKLNGWTLPMITAIRNAFQAAASAEKVQAVILTGSGHYYCAGVDLGGSLKLMHPKQLHHGIVELNQQLFETFIRFPKPLLIAVNGHAIGASVTSATLADAIIAADSATFLTPFARLGVPAEGCSSVTFAKLLGADNAARMLGAEGWQPSASEAKAIGLIQYQVADEALMAEATAIATAWVEQGKQRLPLVDFAVDELLAINQRESIAVANALLGAAFLKEQARFFARKKKRALSLMFWILWGTRPIWSRLL